MRGTIRGQAAIALVLLVALLSAGVALPASAAPPRLSPPVLQAIGALVREKAQRTPRERKLASRLLHANRMRRGLPIAPGVASLAVDLERDAGGRVLVDLKGEITPALIARIEAIGGRVVTQHPRFEALRAWLPLERLDALADEPAVRRIRPADRAHTQGLFVSEGDAAHRANLMRALPGVDGSGIQIGVLSDGVASLASVVASGDLPPDVTVLPGQAGSGSEGTAMLEIIHDLAPGASLLFATGFGSQATMASNILALRAAGADVLVDDVAYFAEAAFQDDTIAAAVDQVRADGALYFSSAGNSGNLNDGTAGVYEADFVPGENVNGLIAHDYGAGDFLNGITLDSPFGFTLHWNDPLGASSNDYDLFLVNGAGTSLLAASTNLQNGNDDPFEAIGSAGNDFGRQLIVLRHPGSANRHFHLNANRGRLEHTTIGQTAGHGSARGAISVAAVDARGHAVGFSGTESVEPYSSDGPRRIYFEANGSAITPGDLTATGGELRAKPDLAAADCVSTATPGFNPFCGTSAAAPHAAALAALLIDRAGGPGLADPISIRAALFGSALDIEAPGPDRDAGAGLIDGFAASQLVPAGCTTPADCNDGASCNGVELCTAGLCAPGAPPACSGATPFCDEALDACVACLGAGDCDDGQFCNGAELCQGGACVPGAPPVCSGPTPFCDEAGDLCVACLASGDCNDALFCNGTELCVAGACAPGTPPVCSGATALCDDGAASCVQCVGDGDCPAGPCVANVCTLAPPAPGVPAMAAPVRILLVAALAAVALLGSQKRT